MDPIAIANLVSSTITALTAIFIAFIALQQTARPEIDVRMKSDLIFPPATECIFAFEVINVGHWYAAPAATNINIWPNFDPSFVLKECRFGSIQEKINTHVRSGKGGLTFVRAEGMKLSHRSDSEEFHVVGRTPDKPGNYTIVVAAISENGASCRRSFEIEVSFRPS